MPYIEQARRKEMKEMSNPGDLNYLITKLLLAYLKTKGESYQTYNDIIGALEGAKLEIYRRKIAQYENTKIDTNGDVY